MTIKFYIWVLIIFVTLEELIKTCNINVNKLSEHSYKAGRKCIYRKIITPLLRYSFFSRLDDLLDAPCR